MTERSIAWDGITTGDAGPYSSADWALLWKYLIGTGASRANVGPFLDSGTTPNNGLKVQAQSPAAAAVDVLAGSAVVAGRFYLSDATEALVIAANASGNPRIDTVVLQADYSLQTVVLAVLQGTPAVSPTPPNLTQTLGVLYEIPLADIAVANGFASIANTDITPRHEWANAAAGLYPTVLNNSGSTLTTGAPVIADTSANQAATTTTTTQDRRVIGVWVGRTSNGDYGRILTHGVGYVYSAAAVTRGQWLVTHTVAAQATPVNYSVNTVIGRALETTTGAGLVLCYVNVRRIVNTDIIHVQDQKASGTNPASIVSGAWRTRELNTEVTDTGSIASVAGNQVTVAAGTYLAFCAAPSSVGNSVNRLRIRDTTAGATLVQGSDGGQSISTLIVNGYFTLTAQSVLELQHYTTLTGNGGAPVTTGEVEVYANVYLIRIGEEI